MGQLPLFPESPFDPMYARTQTALKYLIQNSLDFQRSDFGKDQRKRMGYNTSFIDYYCTVRMTGPRRSGHTTAMFKVGEEMFQRPLYLFHNADAERTHKQTYLDLFAKKCNECGQPSKKEVATGSFGCLHTLVSKMRGRSFDAVLVDCGFFMSRSAQEELRNMSVACSAPFESFCLVYVQ
jgi:hypothetical protein